MGTIVVVKHHKTNQFFWLEKSWNFAYIQLQKAWEQKSVGLIVRTVEGSLVWMEIKSKGTLVLLNK